MMSKYLATAVLAGLVSVSFLGCGSDDAEKPAEPASTTTQTPTNTAKTLEERKAPIRFDVSGIEVSKEDMDKFIPYARDKKLTEDDVRYTVALLKLCGMDFNRIRVSERGGITLYSLPGELEWSFQLNIDTDRNSNGEFCITKITTGGGIGLLQ